MIFERAAVVGLGLIGGSIARELACRGAHVSGYDSDARELRAALEAGVVNRALDVSLAGVSEAELAIIAVPVDAALGVLQQLAPHLSGARLVTDVGSTKARIVEAATQLGLRRFVGSHPVTGDHRSGWDSSRVGLFLDARVFLCPAQADSESLDLAKDFWRELGGHPAVIDADRHDARLAWTSHLPQVVSTALALALARSGIARADLGPGGRDVTRLAGSSPDMWAAIAQENGRAIDEALATIEQQIADIRAALTRGGPDAIRGSFVEAREWFDEDPSS